MANNDRARGRLVMRVLGGGVAGGFGILYTGWRLVGNLYGQTSVSTGNGAHTMPGLGFLVDNSSSAIITGRRDSFSLASNSGNNTVLEYIDALLNNSAVVTLANGTITTKAEATSDLPPENAFKFLKFWHLIPILFRFSPSIETIVTCLTLMREAWSIVEWYRNRSNPSPPSTTELQAEIQKLTEMVKRKENRLVRRKANQRIVLATEKNKLRAMAKQNKAHAKALTDLRKDLSMVTGTIVSGQKESNDQAAEMRKDMNDQLAELSEEMAKMGYERLELHNGMEALKKENESLKDAMQKSNRMMESMKGDASNIEAAQGKLSEGLDHLRESMAVVEKVTFTKINHLISESTSSKSLLESVTGEQRALQIQVDGMDRKINTSEETVAMQLDHQFDDISTIKTILASTGQKNNAFKDIVDKIVHKAEEFNRHVLAEIDYLKEECNATKANTDSVAQSVSVSLSEIDSVKSTIEEHAGLLSNIDREYAYLDEHRRINHRSIEDQQSDLTTLADKVDELAQAQRDVESTNKRVTLSKGLLLEIAPEFLDCFAAAIEDNSERVQDFKLEILSFLGLENIPKANPIGIRNITIMVNTALQSNTEYLRLCKQVDTLQDAIGGQNIAAMARTALQSAVGGSIPFPTISDAFRILSNRTIVMNARLNRSDCALGLRPNEREGRYTIIEEIDKSKDPLVASLKPIANLGSCKQNLVPRAQLDIPGDIQALTTRSQMIIDSATKHGAQLDRVIGWINQLAMKPLPGGGMVIPPFHDVSPFPSSPRPIAMAGTPQHRSDPSFGGRIHGTGPTSSVPRPEAISSFTHPPVVNQAPPPNAPTHPKARTPLLGHDGRFDLKAPGFRPSVQTFIGASIAQARCAPADIADVTGPIHLDTKGAQKAGNFHANAHAPTKYEHVFVTQVEPEDPGTAQNSGSDRDPSVNDLSNPENHHEQVSQLKAPSTDGQVSRAEIHSTSASPPALSKTAASSHGNSSGVVQLHSEYLTWAERPRLWKSGWKGMQKFKDGVFNPSTADIFEFDAQPDILSHNGPIKAKPVINIPRSPQAHHAPQVGLRASRYASTPVPSVALTPSLIITPAIHPEVITVNAISAEITPIGDEEIRRTIDDGTGIPPKPMVRLPPEELCEHLDPNKTKPTRRGGRQEKERKMKREIKDQEGGQDASLEVGREDGQKDGQDDGQEDGEGDDRRTDLLAKDPY